MFPTRTPRSRTTLRTSLAVATLAVALAAPWPARGAEAAAELPDADRAQIEQVLRAKTKALLDEKNADGNSFKRGVYPKRYRSADGQTCETTFLRQTALTDKLVTERFLVTLKKDASGAWSIAGEKPLDTFDRVYRNVPGDEKFFKFQKLNFVREGLRVTASNGSLMRDSAGGRGQLTVAAADLAYAYEPPASVGGMYLATYRGYLKDYSKDLVFTPQLTGFTCTDAECEAIVTSSFAGLEPISKAQANPVLVDDYDKDQRELEKARKERAFSGFNVPPYADRKYYSVFIKRKGADHFFSLSYDNYEPKEVQVYVTQLGPARTPFPIVTHYSDETIRAGTQPYELERRSDAESRFYELTRLDATIDMAIDDPELLKADAVFVLKLRKDLDAIPYRIARVRPILSDQKESKSPRMTVNSVQLEDGTELAAIPTGPISGQILLPKTAKKGETLQLRMQFENRDSIYKLTSSFSYVDRGGWLPFVRFGDMIDAFDLVVRVPSQYKILGIGKEIYQRKVGEVTEARFTSPSPVVFPSIVFGDYVETASSVQATKADGTPIPVRVHMDETSLHDKYPIAVGGTDEYKSESGDRGTFAAGGKMASITEGALPTIANEAASALNAFRDIYGVDYPYSKLDLVNDPFGTFYGQAPSSIVYLGNWVFLPRGLTGVAIFGGADLASFMYSVVAHEVAHQWWGSLIANANDGNYWFVESLAEYSSALWLERTGGMKEYLKKVEDWRRTTLERDVTMSVQDASTMSGPDGGAYQAAVYNKGPLAFHILRSTFGDEKFFPFLKRLGMQLKGTEIVTRDIQAVAEESFGGDMSWFFDQWIRGTGIPQFSFNYETRKTEDGKYLVSGKIRQRVLVGRNRYAAPGSYYRGVVPITVELGKGEEFPAKVLVQGAETPFQFKVAKEPRDVVFNKYHEILAHDVLVNRPF